LYQLLRSQEAERGCPYQTAKLRPPVRVPHAQPFEQIGRPGVTACSRFAEGYENDFRFFGCERARCKLAEKWRLSHYIGQVSW
jgi:hypothetical protein